MIAARNSNPLVSDNELSPLNLNEINVVLWGTSRIQDFYIGDAQLPQSFKFLISY
jgi:hypothetical protein